MKEYIEGEGEREKEQGVPGQELKKRFQNSKQEKNSIKETVF